MTNWPRFHQRLCRAWCAPVPLPRLRPAVWLRGKVLSLKEWSKHAGEKNSSEIAEKANAGETGEDLECLCCAYIQKTSRGLAENKFGDARGLWLRQWLPHLLSFHHHGLRTWHPIKIDISEDSTKICPFLRLADLRGEMQQAAVLLLAFLLMISSRLCGKEQA